MAQHSRSTPPPATPSRPPLRVVAPPSFEVLLASECESLPRDHAARFHFRVPAHWRSPVACNPFASEAADDVIAWFASLGCTPAEIARARKFDIAGYVGIAFPNLSRTLTTRIAKYLSMWLLWDDVQVENLADRWRITSEDLLANRKPEGMTRFDEGWWQLFREFAPRRSARWIEDLVVAMRVWNDAAIDEARAFEAHRVRDWYPTFASQLELRIATIGMYATVYLLEDDYDFELPRAFHASPVVRRIKTLANEIVGLGNDVFSFGKDYSERHLNLISTAMHEDRIDADAALERVIRLHDDALAEYDEHARSIARWSVDADPFIERWIRDVRYASLGFSIWESRAPRYSAFKVVINRQVVEPTFDYF